MNKHILFIHIPKTAGTSFRIAAEEYFGKENTFYDYTLLSDETSKEIKTAIYDANDLYQLYSMISKSEDSFLSGHYSVEKYDRVYSALNIVSFVRNPIEQVISHFNHYKNYHNYKKEFVDFMKEPRFRNTQHSMLHRRPLAYYGFLGLTEEYATSIEMFNALYGTELLPIYANTKSEGSLKIEDIDKKTQDQIKRLNSKDIKLYESIKKQFELRKKLYNKKLPYTYGFIQAFEEKKISGLAFQRESDRAVLIDIYADELYLETVVAKYMRQSQLLNSVPRKGFIGFDYIYEGDDLPGGKLRAVVKGTGQEIV